MKRNRPAQRWDVFCRVVDNYGDAAVCWRLARQLALEYGFHVRLWIDQPSCLELLQVAPREAVEVCLWREDFPADFQVADVVIEAFACELPAAVRDAIRVREPAPVWINLEYLSAEPWIDGCHGLASPDPCSGRLRYFFFPGFSPASGGLLREKSLGADSAPRFVLPPCSPTQAVDPLRISLFAYTLRGLEDLLRVWAEAAQPIQLWVPGTAFAAQLGAVLGGQPLQAGEVRQWGAIEVRMLPFLAQDDYDALLAACDLNFVRGEDSFVRAQWAQRPLVWQIYPQAEQAHTIKLEAFLARYTAQMDPEIRLSCVRFWRSWNGLDEAPARVWPEFARRLPQLQASAQAWAQAQRAHGDLAENLVSFVASR